MTPEQRISRALTMIDNAIAAMPYESDRRSAFSNTVIKLKNDSIRRGQNIDLINNMLKNISGAV